jgi:hypothetical protein
LRDFERSGDLGSTVGVPAVNGHDGNGSSFRLRGLNRWGSLILRRSLGAQRIGNGQNRRQRENSCRICATHRVRAAESDLHSELHGGYISRKLRIIWWPPSVKTLSGWN